MGFNLEPFSGAGAVRFGTTPTAIRSQLGADFRSFRRSPASKHPCDHFLRLGLFANFDERGELEAIELASPAQAKFEGVNLIGMPLDEAKPYLQSRGATLEESEAGTVVAKSLGVRPWGPEAKGNPQAPVESVLLATRDC
jgi:hypothetical protein